MEDIVDLGGKNNKWKKNESGIWVNVKTNIPANPDYSKLLDKVQGESPPTPLPKMTKESTNSKSSQDKLEDSIKKLTIAVRKLTKTINPTQTVGSLSGNPDSEPTSIVPTKESDKKPISRLGALGSSVGESLRSSLEQRSPITRLLFRANDKRKESDIEQLKTTKESIKNKLPKISEDQLLDKNGNPLRGAARQSRIANLEKEKIGSSTDKEKVQFEEKDFSTKGVLIKDISENALKKLAKALKDNNNNIALPLDDKKKSLFGELLEALGLDMILANLKKFGLAVLEILAMPFKSLGNIIKNLFGGDKNKPPKITEDQLLDKNDNPLKGAARQSRIAKLEKEAAEKIETPKKSGIFRRLLRFGRGGAAAEGEGIAAEAAGAEGVAAESAGGLGLIGAAALPAAAIAGGGLLAFGGNKLADVAEKHKLVSHKQAGLAKILSDVGGGALAGAGGGALIGGVGAIPGAVVGGLGGLAYGLWDQRNALFDKENTDTNTPVKPKTTTQTQNLTQANRKNIATKDQMLAQKPQQPIIINSPSTSSTSVNQTFGMPTVGPRGYLDVGVYDRVAKAV